MPVRAPAGIPLGLPWFALRKWRRRATFTEGARYEIVVPHGPDGRPGERLVVPSPPIVRVKVIPGARYEFLVVLDRHGSTLNALCFGRVADRGEPEQSARDTVEDFWKNGWAELTPVVAERVGGEDAFRYRAALPHGELTEWKFAHDGWLYAAGAINRAPDEVVTGMRARAVLDTWEWLDDADRTG